MAERFEDLIVWQKARELTRNIYLTTRAGKFARHRGLASQIQRASVSIMSNIAEGFDRFNPRDFHRFLVIAKASFAEVRCQLYVAVDVDYIDQIAFEKLMKQADEVHYLISSLRNSIARKHNL